MTRERVLVGLSGGVDSAVAARLLLDQGYDVEGLFMHNWDGDDAYCTSADDFQSARRVARVLGIPLHRVDFAREYRERVFAAFLDEHRRGRTPNPDVLCNREIKFGVCFDYARSLGADLVATGHYARLRQTAAGAELLRAVDAAKDQTYFLYEASPAALRQTLFPLGELLKPAVREIARRRGLPVHDRRDSTGICFIGERPFADFLAEFLPAAPGAIETPEGKRLGEHRGLWFHTLGQRAPLGGQRGAAPLPWYVAAKDTVRNVLVVVQGEQHPLLFAPACTTGPATWLAGAPPSAAFDCTVKLRYRQHDVPCRVEVRADGTLSIAFDQPQRAVTPGQSAVLYSGDRCLGGSVITATSHGAAQRAVA